ncbi:MAG: acyl carrier protein, partial [Coriobacteriia bacterium]|nr:acyl carrier protein [Coriobacteriia bacterium]
MDFESARGTVLGVVSEVSGIPPCDIGDDDHLVDGLGIDSLGMLNVLVGLEESFRTRIPDRDVIKLKTVRTTTEYLQSVASPPRTSDD